LRVLVAHSRRAASRPAQEPRSRPAAVIKASGKQSPFSLLYTVHTYGKSGICFLKNNQFSLSLLMLPALLFDQPPRDRRSLWVERADLKHLRGFPPSPSCSVLSDSPPCPTETMAHPPVTAAQSAAVTETVSGSGRESVTIAGPTEGAMVEVAAAAAAADAREARRAASTRSAASALFPLKVAATIFSATFPRFRTATHWNRASQLSMMKFLTTARARVSVAASHEQCA
jgi:hypothetical protein